MTNHFFGKLGAVAAAVSSLLGCEAAGPAQSGSQDGALSRLDVSQPYTIYREN